ncbi:MAG: prephenate dehydrogenase [Desulfovibrionaceae bacterium]|nr:prephenate dehydrogenase [Desulfovibrionaceae bacterium]
MSDLKNLKVCIIGSRGQMGQLFTQCWNGKIGGIYPLDRRPDAADLHPDDIERVVPHVDVLIVSVPLSRFDSVLAAVAPALQAGTILSDVGSVKVQPMQLMEKYHAGPVVGTHPLFGPRNFFPASSGATQADASSPVRQFLKEAFHGLGKQVAITPGRNCPPHALETVDTLFRLGGCDTFITSAAEHDRAIGTIQSLNFLSHLAYFSTAAAIPGLARYVTPSFVRRLLAARTMLGEDAGLFTNIARHTPDMQETIKAYVQNLEKAGRLDNDSLNELLQTLEIYFKPEQYNI